MGWFGQRYRTGAGVRIKSLRVSVSSSSWRGTSSLIATR